MKTMKTRQIQSKVEAVTDVATGLGWTVLTVQGRFLKFLVPFATVNESMARAEELSQAYGLYVSVMC